MATHTHSIHVENQKQYDELEDQSVMKTIFCNGFLTDNLSISDIRNTISQSI